MIALSNQINGLSNNLFLSRCDTFVKRLASHGVNVKETSQLMIVADTTTIENWNNKSETMPVTTVIGKNTTTITRVIDCYGIPISFQVSTAAS